MQGKKLKVLEYYNGWATHDIPAHPDTEIELELNVADYLLATYPNRFVEVSDVEVKDAEVEVEKPKRKKRGKE
jgi:hypothetical protein